ncbi:MAG: hypothetical protein LJE94_07130 [Deltaproteobacteria bacterium]|nr:hypothetical protein [Deltaproteobacteria bacterium]
MNEKNKRSQADIEWENRTLCSDESCIGVIGPDGRCKECGLPFDGEFTPLQPVDETGDASAGPEENATADRGDDTAEDFEEDMDVEWENRTLCSDESCIGVIGPDGRCKECGRPLDDGAA